VIQDAGNWILANKDFFDLSPLKTDLLQASSIQYPESARLKQYEITLLNSSFYGGASL
jgi:hypothetical protein